MEKTYDPQSIESKWYQSWESTGSFTAKNTKPAYCILLPPPNVTGSLHMGHGFQDSIMDALIRYHRMLGENVLWQAGTDHAGIATQMVVERKLLLTGKTRHDLGREEFIKTIWQWKAESGNMITQQLRRLGASIDWSRERFTMDENYSHAVNTVFIKLYEEGLIYRGQRLVNWDPELLTAVSDLEVISEEVKGEMWFIRYPLANSQENLVVATTRPETLLGDVAVAVHPDDDRYKKFIGQKVKLPLTNREIPVIADISVDPAFGSGCVKITPAHDFNDYQTGQRHQLPIINIFHPDARLNQNVPQEYQGLDRYTARKKIVEDLTRLNLLEKTEQHLLNIPRGDRTNAIIEPFLTDQWFMKMKPLAKPAIDAVKNGQIKFIPEGWTKTYLQWLENIEDWCISRQLWWGHQIPAWYDPDNKIYVGNNEEEIRKKFGLDAAIPLKQESDVLDTWFSAALWPFASLGWPQSTPDLKTFFPTNVLVTGFDIIFFWVARMVMLSLKFTQQIPFSEIYITGLIRDQDGQKMSKSKGNVLDPIDLIDGIELEQLVKKRISGLMQPAMGERIANTTREHYPQGIPAFGTDALRITYLSLASNNREIRFDLNRVAGYRNFCNKIWNAARFVLLHTEGEGKENLPGQKNNLVFDRWILTRLQQTIEQVHKHFKDYRFDLLVQALYEFVWNEYCDWYLEFSKIILGSEAPHQQQMTRYTLLVVLETILRLFHPLMPFITEEIWQRVAPLIKIQAETIMLQAYPKVDPALIDDQSLNEVEWLKTIVLNLRTIRSEATIAPGRQIPLLLQKGNSNDKILFEKHQDVIKRLAKLQSIQWLAANDPIPQAAMALVGDLQLLIPLAGLIDIDAEKKRIRKDLDKLEKDFEQLNAKLANSSFLQNAPAPVVEKEKLRKNELELAVKKLQEQLIKLES